MHQNGSKLRRGAPSDPAQQALARVSAGRTVLAVYAQHYLLFGVMHGLDPECLCAAAGFSRADVVDRDRQLPYAWVYRLQRALIDSLPTLAVGFELGKLATLDVLGYLGQALRNCDNALAALRLHARYARLLDSAYRYNPPLLMVSDATVEARWPILPPDPPECIEADFVAQINLMRAQQPELVLHGVRFGHERDQALQARLRVFFGCPVHFGSEVHGLIFGRGSLEKPLANADSEARRHLESHVEGLIGALREPLVATVGSTIESILGSDDLSLGRVAKLLGLSPRGLQRALKEQGVAYKDLLVQTRSALARRLLSRRTLAIYEVALAVGYDDLTAFSRAFRQWSGQSPRAYRDSCVQAEA